jgi:hypothetical protein
MAALRALMSRRPRRRIPATGQGLLGAGFLRAVEPPAMTLDTFETTDAESGEQVLTPR